MATTNTLWKLDEHTIGKHMVLKAYMQAWLPVMGLTNEKILVVDGFAGPGEYEGGELGSPQILINAYLEHFYQDKLTNHIIYYFLEKSPKRYAHLCELLKRNYSDVPSNVAVKAHCKAFSSRLSELLDDTEKNRKVLVPSFFMIDPFGVSDTPMSIISRILRNPKAEVYISFMYEFINRFKRSPEFGPHLTELFGTERWQDGVHIECKNDRRKFFNELYKSQLKKAGAKQVLHFELYNGNRHVYTIFFATTHIKGIEKMKSAIWRYIPDGSYQFRGGIQQTKLDAIDIDYSPLHDTLRATFKDRYVTAQTVLHFIASDATDYATDSIKTKYLKVFEKKGLIDVEPASRNRRFSYPDNALLKFLPRS